MNEQEFKMRLYLDTADFLRHNMTHPVTVDDFATKVANEAEAIFSEYKRRNAPKPATLGAEIDGGEE